MCDANPILNISLDVEFKGECYKHFKFKFDQRLIELRTEQVWSLSETSSKLIQELEKCSGGSVFVCVTRNGL